MKKKHFRLFMFGHSVLVADTVLLAAARSNSEWADISLKGLKGLGESLMTQDRYKEDTELVAFELVGDNMLCIDAKIQGVMVNVALIEQVEIFEPVILNEEEDEPTYNNFIKT